MLFHELSVFFYKIEKTSSRLSMTEILSELFKKISAQEIDKVIYLLQGSISPQYEKKEFALGEKLLSKALSKALHLDPKKFIEKYNKIGDLGETVEYYRQGIKTIEEKDCSIIEVFNKLKMITELEGAGSQDAKLKIIGDLVRTLDPLSCRFIIRIPTNTLRLGFSDMTILDSFSWMIAGDKSLRPLIEKAYHVRPDLGYLGKVLKENGIEGIKNVLPVLFTPILMMKAERLSSSADILKKIGKGIIEPKYDGFRLQIHYRKKDKLVKLFSRGLEDVTFMYPDIVEGVYNEVIADEIIFEGEAIGYDPKTNIFLPFQETVQRKRKYNIEAKSVEVPLRLFVFELLFANGVNYLDVPFIQRRKELGKLIKTSPKKNQDTLLIAPEEIAVSIHEIDNAFEKAISFGMEGIMIKKLDGIYQPGARGWNWIKLKRSYSSKIDDTIDCLVMGYDFGRGKRTEFGIGAFLVGIYNDQIDKFETVAKIGTGLTDDEWRQLKQKAFKLETHTKPAIYNVDKAMSVDIWISPVLIVEIRADEITRSPVHTAGRRLKKTKSGTALEVEIAGYALRFPRLERFRNDKLPQDATTVDEVEKLFKKQRS